MLREALVGVLLTTTAACTSGGDCSGINDDHDIRVVLLDRATGAVTWSVSPAWAGDVEVRAADGRVELVGRAGTDRYDDTGALVSHEDPSEASEASGITVAALNARRDRWAALPVGAPFPEEDRAAVVEASSLPTGPARAAALNVLDLVDVHGDLWWGGLRSTASFRDGRLLWRRSPLAGNPVTTTGDQVVLQQRNRLLAVRLSDGSPVWRRATAGAWSAPALETPRGLVAAEGSRFSDTGEDGRVHLIDLDDGRSRWTTPVTGHPRTLVLDGADVVVGSSVKVPEHRPFSEQYTGAVTRLASPDGALTWKVSLTEGPVVGTVPLARGITVVANDGSIGCE